MTDLPPMTDPRVGALAKAIHTSHDHPNRPGCLDMDRDSAAAILAALPPCGHEAEITRLRDGLRESAGARHAIGHHSTQTATGDLIEFDACERLGCVSARTALAGGSE